jgi:large subunit ribosomal protein L19
MDIKSIIPIKKNPHIPELRPGDTVKVSLRVKEADRERLQAFQGVVLKLHRGGAGATFTVRRISYSVGVEKTFLLHSPMLEKVEILRRGDVRRAKLHYLRGLSGRAARIKEKAPAKEKEAQEGQGHATESPSS